MVSSNKNMEVSGAMPTTRMSVRGNRVNSTSMTVSTPGVTVKRYAPVVESLSSSASITMDAARGVGRSIQKCVKAGNSSPDALGRVDGQAPGGQAVQQIFRHGAKVARALKHQELVPDLFRVDVPDEPESGQRQRHLAAGMLRHRPHGEHGGRCDQILGHPGLDRGHRDRGRPLIETRAQQLEAKRQSLLAPDRGIAVEEDGVVLLRTQLVEVRGAGCCFAECRASLPDAWRRRAARRNRTGRWPRTSPRGAAGARLRAAGAAALDTPTAVIVSTDTALAMANRNIATPFVEKSPRLPGMSERVAPPGIDRAADWDSLTRWPPPCPPQNRGKTVTAPKPKAHRRCS